MTDELDEAAFRRTVLKMTGQETGEERPVQRGYAFDDPQRFERWARARAEEKAAAEAKANPKPVAAPYRNAAPATDWLDEKMAAFVEASVGPAIEEISTMIAGELDKESASRARLEDRVRELMLEQAKAATTIAKLEVSVGHLELRLANGDRRTGAIIDSTPSLKLN
jgi:hypothetical protein